MIKNKNEVRFFYETHKMSLKDVAAHFNMSYRTLAHWVKCERWEAGKGIDNIENESIRGEIVKAEFASVLDSAKNKIKREINANVGAYASEIESVVRDNMLNESVNQVLLMAISQDFIQKNIMLSGLLAKDELLRMNALRDPAKPDPMFIACAEKVARIFESMQVSLYGKDAPKIAASSESVDYSKMSENELLAIINS